MNKYHYLYIVGKHKELKHNPFNIGKLYKTGPYEYCHRIETPYFTIRFLSLQDPPERFEAMNLDKIIVADGVSKESVSHLRRLLLVNKGEIIEFKDFGNYWTKETLETLKSLNGEDDENTRA